jgi:hypothetical protein
MPTFENEFEAAVGAPSRIHEMTDTIEVSLHQNTPGDEAEHEVSYLGYSRTLLPRSDDFWIVNGATVSARFPVEFAGPIRGDPVSVRYFLLRSGPIVLDWGRISRDILLNAGDRLSLNISVETLSTEASRFLVYPQETIKCSGGVTDMKIGRKPPETEPPKLACSFSRLGELDFDF